METPTRLSGLLNLTNRWDRFAALLAGIRGGEQSSLAMAEGAKPFLMAALQGRLAAPILVVTARPGRARDLREQMAMWSAAPERVLLFPEPDSLPYERMPVDPMATSGRLAALAVLAEWSEGAPGSASVSPARAAGDKPLPYGPEAPPVVVASVRAMMELILSPEELKRSN